MKSLLLTLLAIPFLIGIPSAEAAIVQTVSGNGGGYVNSYTISVTPTAGDTLIMTLTSGAADSGYTVTDNKNNTWTKRQGVINSGQRLTDIWDEQNVASGATTITITFMAGQFNDSAYILREYSGLTTTSYDTGAIGNDYGAFIQSHTSSTTPTTAQASEILVGGGGCANTGTPTSVAGSGYGNGLEQKGFDNFTWDFMEDQSVSSVGTQVATWSTTAFATCETVIGTYKTTTASTPAVSSLIILFQ